MTRLLLVRHAPTDETGIRLTGRLPGVGLSAAGRDAAARLARAFRGSRVAGLYSSPITRTKETAALVGSATGTPVVVHRGFEEVDYGAWSGRTLKSLRRTNLWRLLHVAPSRAEFPQGESLVAVQARVVSACEELAARHPRGTVVAVSHGDVIKAALAHYLGMPLDLFQRLTVAPTSVSAIDLGSGLAPRVLMVNGSGPV